MIEVPIGNLAHEIADGILDTHCREARLNQQRFTSVRCSYQPHGVTAELFQFDVLRELHDKKILLRSRPSHRVPVTRNHARRQLLHLHLLG